MISYDCLPRLGPAPIRTAYFAYRPNIAPYNIPYVMSGGQIYLSLEHLVALACSKRAVQLIHYDDTPQGNLVSPCFANIGASANVFKQCKDAAIDLGAKVIMCDGEFYALGLPLDAMHSVLKVLKRALSKENVRPNFKQVKVHQNKINRITDLIEERYIELIELLLIDSGLKPKPALATPVTINARQGDSVPEKGIKRPTEKLAPCRPGSYTARRIPTFPYFSWLY